MFQTQLEPQRTPTRWTGSEGPAIRLHKQRANEYMRDALRLLDPDDLIPFFCECDRPECFATVWLTGRGFDRARATPDQELSAHGEALPVAAAV